MDAWMDVWWDRVQGRLARSRRVQLMPRPLSSNRMLGWMRGAGSAESDTKMEHDARVRPFGEGKLMAHWPVSVPYAHSADPYTGLEGGLRAQGVSDVVQCGMMNETLVLTWKVVPSPATTAVEQATFPRT
mgnify:CR=1 FL=1